MEVLIGAIDVVIALTGSFISEQDDESSRCYYFGEPNVTIDTLKLLRW